MKQGVDLMSKQESKFCPYCKKDKPLSEWSDVSKTTPYCKKCWGAYMKRYKAAHRVRSLEINRKCWDKNKDRYNLDRKSGGRTLYEVLFIQQRGVCAICGNPEGSKRYKTLTVDHCHTTEKIRGLLCSNCNRALGMFRDNLSILKSAVKYLRKHET